MEEIAQCPGCESSRWEPLRETAAQMHLAGAERFRFCACQFCGLVFLNPRVEPEQLAHYYTEAYLPYRGAAAWGIFGGLVEADQRSLDRKRVEVVRQALGGEPFLSRDLLLDVGCGKPTFLNAARSLGGRSLGIDFSDHGWADTPERFDGLDLRVGQVADLSGDLEPRVISMWHYLEHDYAPADTLARLREISTERTRLIIEVPNHDSETRKQYGDHWAGYHTPRHLSLFSPKSLSALLQRTGWTVVRMKGEGTLDPYVLDWMSRMERRGIDWSGSMQRYFPGFVLGMARFRLQQRLRRKRSWGILTAVARPA